MATLHKIVLLQDEEVPGDKVLSGIEQAVSGINQKFPSEHYVVKKTTQGGRVIAKIVDTKALLYAGATRAVAKINPADAYKNLELNVSGNWNWLSGGGARHYDAFIDSLRTYLRKAS